MTQQPQDANSILMGGGAPALKFEQIGTMVTGTVLSEPTTRQQTDFRTKTPETWPDGSPKMQVLVELSTTLRDPQRPDDDGARTLFIKGKELTNAIRNAVRQAGANGIHTGGVLTVQYVADGPKPDPNLSAPKLYAANYQPPAVSFNGVAGPGQQQAPAAQPVYQQPAALPAQMPQQYAPQAYPPAPQQMPAPAPIPTPQPAQVLPTAAASDTPPPNVDPAMWARLSPEQRAAVAAASAQQAAGY